MKNTATTQLTHTPGPWIVTEGLDIRTADGNRHICDATVGETLIDYKLLPIDERTANASLIAAAPDLLAALEALVGEADLGEVDLSEPEAALLAAARAAIAKATAARAAAFDTLTRSQTAFSTFAELIDAAGGYFPSLDTSRPDNLRLADAYDAAQAARHDSRRAHRWQTLAA